MSFIELREVEPVMGPLVFGLFTLMMFYIAMNIFISIINDAYEAVKNELETAEMTDQNDLFNYIGLKIKYLTCCKKNDNEEVMIGNTF